MWNVMFYVNI